MLPLDADRITLGKHPEYRYKSVESQSINSQPRLFFQLQAPGLLLSE
jgi:hypothetical protein